MEGSAVKLRQRSNGRRGNAPCFGTMKVVSVINYKGGVGKTTLTGCIASCLVRAGKKVMLVDMDPQCNLTCSIVSPEIWAKVSKGEVKTLRNWYGGMCGDQPAESLRSLFLLTQTGKFAIAPSHLDLLDVDMELSAYIAKSGSDESQRRVEILGALRRQLRPLAEKHGFDLVLLDCPPNFNIVTQTAIIASDNILIPTRPNPISNMGFDHLIRRRGMLIEKFNQDLDSIGESDDVLVIPKILGVVPMMWKVAKGDKSIIDNAVVQFELLQMLNELGIKEGSDIFLFRGIRHNEKLFSKSRLMSIIDDDYAKGESGGKNAADDFSRTGRQIAEVLEILQPDLSWVSGMIPRLKINEIDRGLTIRAIPHESMLAGEAIASRLYHLPVEFINRAEVDIHRELRSHFGGEMAIDARHSFWRAISKLNSRAAYRLGKLRAEEEQS